MLQLNAIDALLHRVTGDAVLKWLNGVSKPRKMPFRCLPEVAHISPVEQREA